MIGLRLPRIEVEAARWMLVAAALCIAFLSATAGPLPAQASCWRPTPEGSAVQRRWDPPLDRLVTLRVTEVSLRDALDLLAASAGVRISYSSDLLPVSRPVCYAATAPLGEILLQLAGDVPATAVAVAEDHIVLTPVQGRPVLPPSLSGVIPLQRILVSGSPGGASQRGLAVAVDVLNAEDIRGAAGRGTVGSLINSAVPGVWVWDQAPLSLLLRYGSIRGASSFGASYPKIYIDGVEVANPLLMRRLIPETIERVEVIRGPQGAALHGMDAISGVINIVTRQGGSSDGSPEILFRSEIGLAESDFRSAASLAHEHAAALRLGTGRRSGGLDLELGNFGHVVPDASSRYVNANANFRSVGATSVITSLFRFSHETASTARSPLLRGLAERPQGEQSRIGSDQRVLQYTAGLRARVYPDGRWDHTLVAGIDGDRVTRVTDDRTPLPIGSEAWMAAADGGADRITLRASSVGRYDLGPSSELRFTLTGEHSNAWESAFESRPAAGSLLADQTSDTLFRRHDQSLGLAALSDVTIRDRFYGTIGGRIEQRIGGEGLASFVALPVLGAAYVFEGGGVTAKLRAAYGRGTRPVRGSIQGARWPGSYLQIRSPDLRPEEQSGLEGGVDLSVGPVLSVQFTAFDQVASNLVQRVGLRALDDGEPQRPRVRRLPYMLQNLGEISNRGWEVDAAADLAGSVVSIGIARVDSRVEQTVTGYTGDLRAGDRMLAVPKWTYSLGVSRTLGPVSIDVSAFRAADWINYDRARLAADFNAPDAAREDFIGENLRAYWRRYDGTTRVSASVDFEWRPGLAVVLAADNLLDNQIGQPDNTAVLPGRSLTLGMRARL